MDKLPDNLDVALDAREKGIVAIPCEGKVPLVKWKRWQEEMPPLELQVQWFRTRCNIAIICTGMVVFDCDDPAKAGLVIEKCGDTPHKLKTPSGGIHFGYRRRRGLVLTNQVRIKGMAIDLRTDGGLELIPESVTEKGRYEWLGPGLRPISELPVANIGWIRERPRRRPSVVASIDAGAGTVRRAKAYVSKIFSISGSGGHNACYRAFCICKEFGLTKEEALLVMSAWNETNAEPPWSEAELLHKADSVYAAVTLRLKTSHQVAPQNRPATWLVDLVD